MLPLRLRPPLLPPHAYTAYCILHTAQEAFKAEGAAFPKDIIVETWECWSISEDQALLAKVNQSVVSSACW